VNSEQALQDAFSSRSELRALEAQQRATERTKEAASASSLPKLTFDGNWGYQGLSATNSVPTYLYQVTARFPLFTGGKIQAEKAKASIELDKVARERDELQQKITLEVKTANAVLAAARNEVEVANLAVQLANDEVVQARDRFEAGVSNNIELITAQDELARANDNQIGALYRYNQARADLAHATGHMESLYAR
jgi:outer membrane protein TolC